METENKATQVDELYQKIKAKTLSYSSLKEFAKSPEHFVHYMNQKKEPSPAMIFGSLLDKMILTPDTWKESFVVMPSFDRRKTADKIAYEQFITENQGKTFVTEDDIVKAEHITEKVFKNKQAMELLNSISRTQEKIEFTDKKTGLNIVGYLDGRGDGIIMDLKSCQSADPKKFLRQALDLDYDLQAATYLTGVASKFFEFPEYYFLCVETNAPYGISVCKVSDEIVEYGKERLRTILDSFKYCLDEKLFHSSYEFRSMFHPHILELPGWLKKRE